jgi:rare lipoprotein A (peptidoglycan hydrolase)
MDLSYAAAVKLGFDLQGTAPVRLTVVVAAVGGPVPRTMLASVGGGAGAGIVVGPTSSASGVSAANGGSGPYLQAGAFRSRESAERMQASIR